MCGIAGAYAPLPRESSRPLVEAIVQSQIPRGPDHQAIESLQGRQARVDLGHSRLSIIDLSADAHQPMWDADRQIAIVFNGEIYNYVELAAELTALGHAFRTKSDTEVILEAYKEWGEKAFKRFNGMFAFGLYDARTEKILLVRDRFGVKPLYYRAENDLLAFASSTGVLARRFGLKPDRGYLARGIRYGIFDGGDAAPFEGLKALLPGHRLEATVSGDAVRTRITAWYSLRERIEQQVDELSRETLPALAERVLETLRNAVDIRFRADVPVAISLSGGLDSSSVAALSAERNITGFSFADPADAATEGPAIDALAKAKGIKIHYVRPSLREILDAFPKALDAQGAPFTTGSIPAQYLVFRDVRAQGFKVLLGGQGGDELFMGYRKFQLLHYRELKRERRWLRAFGFLLSLIPQFFAERSQTSLYWKHRKRFDEEAASDTILDLPKPDPIPLGLAPDETLRERQLRDVTQTSLPTLLRYEDANSMGHGVESRLPFLDYRLVELGLAMPVAAKLREGYGKWILREAMNAHVPDSIRLARAKRGFDVPQASWIEAGLGDRIREELGRSDEAFSNRSLSEQPRRFLEAVCLLFLKRAEAR